MRLAIASLDTPVGRFHLAGHEGGLCAAGFDPSWPSLERDLAKRFGEVTFNEDADVHGAVEPLTRYFDGDLDALDAIAVDTGGTEFQRSVWRALRTIRVGTTLSYRDLATRLGRPTATRAVGAANGKNPVSIVVPCHRVVAADGTLWGYGGGLEKKEWLLKHEGALLI